MAKSTKFIVVLLLVTVVIVIGWIALRKQTPLGSFQFHNIDSIDVSINAKEFEQHSIRNEDYVFFYFEYVVNNKNTQTVQFDPSEVRIKLNDVVNSETQYHSIASAIAEPITLPSGTSTYYLYCVYPANVKQNVIKSLSLEDGGFSVTAFQGEGQSE